MDVFGSLGEAGEQLLCDAAIDAGYELGVFDALARAAAPLALDELARAIDVQRGLHRLRALVDVLAVLGAVTRDGDRIAAGVPPARPSVPREGWGRLAEVIRSDTPLALPAAADGDATARLHAHLASAGADAARELAPLLSAMSLLDLGGGAGVYTEAFLDAHPWATATIVDAPAVIALARERLARFGDRVAYVEGDARSAPIGGEYGAVLLANVLHFYGVAECAELCHVAARALEPGGVLAIKDLRVDAGRGGPLRGLLFALGMAIYSERGDAHPVPVLASLLAGAGLVDVRAQELPSALDAIVMLGLRPYAREAEVPEGEAAIAAELDRALAATDPQAQLPAGLRRVLARALAIERADTDPAALERAGNLVRHYTQVMPQLRAAQLAGSEEPGGRLFHVPLDWRALPRLSGALDRLFAVLADAGVAATPALGARSAEELRARTPTIAALYRGTHYGGCMPLLYGYPADLAYFARRGAADGLDELATIDRYLTAPMIHELCHFARARASIDPPHLDECIGGWLGVYVHPELAYPGAERDDAIYAAPWLAQVGQAVARAFGVDAVVRAQAGAQPWEEAVSDELLRAAARLGRDDWRARRTSHFLSDTFEPEPWIAMALLAGAGYTLADDTLASLAQVPIVGLATSLREDDAFDRAIVADGIRAMCVANAIVDGSFRAHGRPPEGWIRIDAFACRVSAPARGVVDPVGPRYWLPPAVGQRIQQAGFCRYELQLATLDAIEDAASAVFAGETTIERDDFTLLAYLIPDH